jgi:hypothetical protein
MIEAIANVVVGYSVVTQILIFPVFGLHTTLAQNLKMGAVFSVVSIARSFVLRRIFETIRMRGIRIGAEVPARTNDESLQSHHVNHPIECQRKSDRGNTQQRQ